MRKVYLVFLLIFILGCSNMEKKACFGEKCIELELMQTQEEKARGLMFRDKLDYDKGLLFVYDTGDVRGFWMKNVKFPIDILWLDEDNKIVHIEKNVPVCSDTCPSYSPSKEAFNVIEVNADFTSENDIKVGDVVEITGI